ncbi:UNVERIFIED_CONTAM: microtubule-associated protein 6, partial [Sesamum indicum]
VLSLDFSKTVSDVHPSLHGSSMELVTNISSSTLEGLDQAILGLKTERKFRLQKLKDVAGSLFDLWNLMDTPKEEKVCFLRITSVLGSSESEIVQPDALSLEVIDWVQRQHKIPTSEVERLTKLKASRLKELVMTKRTHIQPDPSTAADKTNALIDSGLVDPCEILANVEARICKAKDEALSRKDIMDKIDRWLSACDEEKWLEDYNQDDNHYSAGRGAHINLKHAERARIMVNEIPGEIVFVEVGNKLRFSVMVDDLISKMLAWEDEKQKLFLYDGARLISILEDYKHARQHKEEEKKRARVMGTHVVTS